MNDTLKEYLKEIIFALIGIILFYVLPLFKIEPMILVFILIVSTLSLSLLIVVLSKYRIKYTYPIFTALIFLPTIPIYYNSSALIHTFWYFGVSVIGLILGLVVNRIIKEK